MRIEWDDNKNRTNRIKHGVSFEVARVQTHSNDALWFGKNSAGQGESLK
ncbi:MAG TPA: hypothetical protein ENI79_05010 [Rhodospirillales bacterium]|nr:hypothetical protein [Rhodospirillales bacterium]